MMHQVKKQQKIMDVTDYTSHYTLDLCTKTTYVIDVHCYVNMLKSLRQYNYLKNLVFKITIVFNEIFIFIIAVFNFKIYIHIYVYIVCFDT